MYAKVFCLEIVMVIIGAALTTASETNTIPQLSRFLILPKPQLRTEYSEQTVSRSDPQNRLVNLSSFSTELNASALKMKPSDPIVLSANHGDEAFQRYFNMRPDFGFIRPVQASDNLIARAFDSVLQPEEYRVGKTATLSCSILTAIKRRNPFCLLNPIFLNLSW